MCLYPKNSCWESYSRNGQEAGNSKCWCCSKFYENHILYGNSLLDSCNMSKCCYKDTEKIFYRFFFLMWVLNSAVQPLCIRLRGYRLPNLCTKNNRTLPLPMLYFLWIFFSRNMNSVSMLEMREGVTVILEYLHTKRRECLNRSD